ncbi:LamG-like jellyroll fold domain-containing protein [Actinoplanes sp. M2I2]|uniref:LamG-like jellyroll fold domain-containing protein n=1 Tax=Actinoplanes sp. M2I2 TaxID=1734444 RepID=UPI0020222C2C|nr:LamG-like jellyroll fold domain-containing protein [Actinoplanes sp. M2I2]
MRRLTICLTLLLTVGAATTAAAAPPRDSTAHATRTAAPPRDSTAGATRAAAAPPRGNAVVAAITAIAAPPPAAGPTGKPTAAAAGSAGKPTSGAAGPTGKPKPSAEAVRYTFDGPAPLADVSGHGHHLSPVSRNGGAFKLVAHKGGKALAFPPPCRDEPCPRIALRAGSTTELNPGRRPLRYGASVRLAADQTTKGENVMQKGYSVRGSQYKLQIDGLAGRPSCVLVDDRRTAIHAAISSSGVADDRWHRLECRRSGARLSILVDGVVRGRATLPADLSVSNGLPFSIGGKGSYADNDQFQGLLDEVWVGIG